MLNFEKLTELDDDDGVMAWKFQEETSRGRKLSCFGLEFSEIRRRDFPPHGRKDVRMWFRYGRCRYLSKFLSREDITEWDASQPVFISAPTGAGKSHFVLSEVLGYVMEEYWKNEEGAKLLILSNRIALNRQLKLDVAERIRYCIVEKEQEKLFQEMLSASPEDFDRFTFDFGPVMVCSYHRLQKDAPNLGRYRLIVCDEFHFFTSDSAFNEYTERMMKRIVREGRNAVRIYMSATPEVAFEPILREEYRCLAERHGWGCTLDIDFFYLERDFNNIEEIFNYRSEYELPEAVRQYDGKWVVFVNSCKRGEDLKAELDEKDRKCVFISTESKSRGSAKCAFDNLVKSESLGDDVDVLICTSVLDNGVNINDATVKNIAIEKFDRVEFLQMLGRVRQIKGHGLRLFIPEVDSKRVTGWLDENMRDLAEKMLCELYGTEKEYLLANGGYICKCTTREANRNSIYQHMEAIHRLQRILSAMGNALLKDVAMPAPNPNFASVYRSFSYEEERMDLPFHNEILQIFSPPNPSEGKFTYGCSVPFSTFWHTVHKKLIPETIEYDTDEAQRHLALADDSAYKTPLEEMLRWIERSIDDCKPLFLVLRQTTAPRYEDFYSKFVVSQTEYDDHLLRANRDTLVARGLEKGSDDYFIFLNLYMPNQKELRSGKNVIIRDVGSFELKSVRTSDAKRNTFYFLLKPVK